MTNDIQRILDQRHHLGWDLWTSADHRLNKGGVFSLMSSLMVLKELDYPQDALIDQALSLIWEAQQADGRFKLSPDGSIYPCHTINAFQVLCAWGHGNDPRLNKTIEHLLSTQEKGGGWRCLKFSYGKGPETDFANPGPTLSALMAFSRIEGWNRGEELTPSVTFLLNHWDAKLPWGPCHYGMGTLFHQVEYPFQTYNLFSYAVTLSHYPSARKDPRFVEAVNMLESKLHEGQVVVERTHPKLADFAFCRKGQISQKATHHWTTIQKNLNRE
jgi:hypothetical protein